MFAHEVIGALRDDLPRMIPAFADDYAQSERDIRDAQHFYLGDVDDIPDACKDGRVGLDPPELIPYIRTPYKRTFFMWRVSHPENTDSRPIPAKKRASCVWQERGTDANVLFFDDFFYNEIRGKWDAMPVWWMVVVGKNMDESGVVHDSCKKVGFDIDHFLKVYPMKGNVSFVPKRAVMRKLMEYRDWEERYSEFCRAMMSGAHEQAGDWKTIMNACVFLNCKNTTKIAVVPPKNLNKSRKKKGKLPILSYHVLAIKKTKQYRTEGNGEPSGKQRIHLCRGHFKHYTDENPLFGKYTGVWWWEASVRGRNRDGIVVKDYTIER